MKFDELKAENEALKAKIAELSAQQDSLPLVRELKDKVAGLLKVQEDLEKELQDKQEAIQQKCVSAHERINELRELRDWAEKAKPYVQAADAFRKLLVGFGAQEKIDGLLGSCPV